LSLSSIVRGTAACRPGEGSMTINIPFFPLASPSHLRGWVLKRPMKSPPGVPSPPLRELPEGATSDSGGNNTRGKSEPSHGALRSEPHQGHQPSR
jgi:hypothetical protein